MNSKRVTMSWSVAAAIFAALVCIAAAAVSALPVAQTRPGAPCPPLVTIQWQPQTLLETRFAAKILEDNKLLKAKLDELAQGKVKSVDDWVAAFQTTYLKEPSLWTGKTWEHGWAKILPLLKDIVSGSAGVSIDSVSALIEYKEFVKGTPFEEDVDAVCRIKTTFSASPGDNILEGLLRHQRPCIIVP